MTPSELTMFDGGKTRIIVLPYGEKTMTICSAVFIQYQRVTDRQTDGRTEGQTDRQNFYINIARQSSDAR